MILIIGFVMEITANGTHQHFSELKGGLTIVGSGNSFSLQDCDLVMTLSGTENILTVKNSSLQLWLNGKRNMFDCENCEIEMLIHGIQNQVLSTQSNVQVFDIQGYDNHIADKDYTYGYGSNIHSRAPNRNRQSSYLSSAQYQMTRSMRNPGNMINPPPLPDFNTRPYNYQQFSSYPILSSYRTSLVPPVPMISNPPPLRSLFPIDQIQEVEESSGRQNRFLQSNRNRQQRPQQRHRSQQRHGRHQRSRSHHSLSDNSIEREEDFQDDESSESCNMFSEQQISQLLVSEYSGEQKQCMICLDQIHRKEKVIFLTCSHSFHVDCCKNWLRKSSKCPLCKIDLHKSMDCSKLIKMIK